MKNIIIIILVFITTSLGAQSAFPTIEESAEHQNAKPYFIQIKESKSDREFFPKLYPIGFVIKERDRVKRKTKYLLGDFVSQEEAEKALITVKESGYKEAFVIKIAK